MINHSFTIQKKNIVIFRISDLFLISYVVLQRVPNPMEKTVSIHAVLTVSIKHVIHLTEPVWRHAKVNLMKINVKQVLLTYRTWMTYVDLWFTVTRWKTKTKNMFAICRRLFGFILEQTSIRLFKASTSAFPIPVLVDKSLTI